MPLPVIAAAWAIGALAGGGTLAGGAGGLKLRRAKRSVEEKRAGLENAEGVTAKCRQSCEESLALLGQAKLRALVQALAPFQEAFSRLQNVDLQMHLDVGGAPVVDQVRVTDAGRLSLSVIDAFGGAAAAGAAGATASGVAITGVTGLAAASTGTSIGALSGAAATNATLAWFGGGALAAGGGGVAAGTMVLTGVAAAPAMLVGGLFLHQKGRQAIAKADRYGADVDSARAKHREAQVVLRAAADLASGVRQLIDQLVPAVTRGTGWLEVVVESESDWTALRLETQERIRSLCVLAVALSDLVHTPLVDEDGALTGAIQEAYVQGQVVAGGIAT